MAEYITKIRTSEGDKQIDYNALANLPESMKNPNAITFVNGVSGSYDGSAPIEVNVPDVNYKTSERFTGFEACWVNNGVFGVSNASKSAIIEAVAGARYDISAVGKYNRFRIYGSDSRESGITPTLIHDGGIAGAGAEYSLSYSFKNTGYKYIIVFLDYNTSDFYCDLSIKEAIGDIDDFSVNGVKLSPVANAIKVEKSGEIITANDVSPVKHNLKVNVATKNLLKYPYYDFTAKGNPVTVNGVTFTDNGDGSITVNGTSTAQTYFGVVSTSFPLKLEKGQTYTLSGFPAGYNTSTAYLNVRNTTYEQHIKCSGNSVTFAAEYTDYYSQIYINSGVTFENVVVWPQLEEGATATEFAPYVADLTAVKVTRTGKNLLPPSSLAASGTTNGVTYTNNGDGSITINGTATAIPYITVAGNLFLPAGTYTLSQQGDDPSPAFIYITGATGYRPVNGKSSRVVTSTGGNCQVYITAAKDDIIENKTLKIMLEMGEEQTDFEAPKHQTFAPKVDGTVEGLTSVSPNMTVSADKGVNIDLTYNADTKMYIDNKFAELQAALISLGGNV